MVACWANISLGSQRTNDRAQPEIESMRSYHPCQRTHNLIYQSLQGQGLKGLIVLSRMLDFATLLETLQQLHTDVLELRKETSALLSDLIRDANNVAITINSWTLLRPKLDPFLFVSTPKNQLYCWNEIVIFISCWNTVFKRFLPFQKNMHANIEKWGCDAMRFIV